MTDPASQAALKAAKSDLGRLCDVLGLKHETHSHLECRLCGHKGCFSVCRNPEKTEQWMFKCFSCGESGSVVDALIKFEKKTVAEACKILTNGTYHPSQRRPEQQQAQPVYGRERPTPVLDTKAAMELIEKAHKYLVAHPEILIDYKRGITMEIIKKYKIGFLRNELVYLYGPNGRPSRFNASWVLPIDDAAGVYHGVKFHHEVAPCMSNGKLFEGKCSWAPFGTEPKEDREKNIKPNHSFYTLWPHPDTLNYEGEEVSMDPQWWINRIPKGSRLEERFETAVHAERFTVAQEVGKAKESDLSDSESWRAQELAFEAMKQDIMDEVLKLTNKAPADSCQYPIEDFVFLCPGELKALAALSDGILATASTGGESWIPPQSLLEPFRGRNVVLQFDDDIPEMRGDKVICAGRIWARRMALALETVNPTSVSVVTCGRMPRPADNKPTVTDVQDGEM